MTSVKQSGDPASFLLTYLLAVLSRMKQSVMRDPQNDGSLIIAFFITEYRNKLNLLFCNKIYFFQNRFYHIKGMDLGIFNFINKVPHLGSR